MKGIIVAAGYGTRFLPVTKTIPKEMLPLINKPSISFIIEEFIQSGIKDIIVISSRRKKVLEDFFDREVELEEIFRREGAEKKLESIKPLDARFSFIRQTEMMGTGHALLQAAPLIGNEPVIVAYPDDIHMGENPLAGQLIKAYEETGCSVLATIHNPPHLERYGVLDLAEDGKHVQGIIEKPPVGQAPSKEVSIGRYLYTPDFFQYLQEGWDKHTGGEYYHVYALTKLMEQGKVVFKETEGERLDTGEPAGFLKATLRYAAQDPELRDIIREEAGNLA
jgi:UTP--glucose-1-phosphate uridylyltransferase